jgi:hypothetical protein
MAELEIRLSTDPRSGRKVVTISYQSEEDALPMEHEEAHRLWVEKVLGAAGIAARDVGQVIVERGAAPIAISLSEDEPGEAEGHSEGR